MALSGNFETFDLNSIFQLLSDDQKTGVLKVRNEDKEIRIYMKDGEIIYATGSHKKDRLGKVLIEQDIISPQRLKDTIQQQIEFLIFNLFLWNQGEFEYEDAALNTKGMIVARINVVSLLFEASRKIDEIAVLKKQIPSDMLVYRLTGKISGKDNDQVTLTAAELRIMGLVDGHRSLRQVIRDGGFDEYSGYKTVYSLLSSGLIEQKTDEPAMASAKQHEKEQKQKSRDYAAIITVYHGILQILFRNIEGELGNEALVIFDQSKQVSACQPYYIFRNLQPNHSVDINVRKISQELNVIPNYQDACQVLIKSFNEFLLNILSKVHDLLGPKMVQLIIQDIDTALPGGKTDQARIGDGEHAIIEIKLALSRAQKHISSKQKPWMKICPDRGLSAQLTAGNSGAAIS